MKREKKLYCDDCGNEILDGNFIYNCHTDHYLCNNDLCIWMDDAYLEDFQIYNTIEREHWQKLHQIYVIFEGKEQQ